MSSINLCLINGRTCLAINDGDMCSIDLDLINRRTCLLISRSNVCSINLYLIDSGTRLLVSSSDMRSIDFNFVCHYVLERTPNSAALISVIVQLVEVAGLVAHICWKFVSDAFIVSFALS